METLAICDRSGKWVVECDCWGCKNITCETEWKRIMQIKSQKKEEGYDYI